MLKKFNEYLSFFKRNGSQCQEQQSNQFKLQIRVNQHCVLQGTLTFDTLSSNQDNNLECDKKSNSENRNSNCIPKQQIVQKTSTKQCNSNIYKNQLQKALDQSNYQAKPKVAIQSAFRDKKSLLDEQISTSSFVQSIDNLNKSNNESQIQRCNLQSQSSSDYERIFDSPKQAKKEKIKAGCITFLSSISNKSYTEEFSNIFEQSDLNRSHHPALLTIRQQKQIPYGQEISKDQLLGFRLAARFKSQKLKLYLKYPQSKGTSKKNMSSVEKEQLFEDIQFMLQHIWQTQSKQLIVSSKQKYGILNRNQMQRSLLASLGSHIRQYLRRNERLESLEALMKVYQNRDYIHIEKKQVVYINKRTITIEKPRVLLLQSIRQFAMVILETKKAIKIA